VSRGVRASFLVNNDFWWQGPQWLKVWESNEVSTQHYTTDIEINNKKCIAFHISHDVNFEEIVGRFSSFKRLVRVIAWCRRFILRSQRKIQEVGAILQVHELHEAESFIFKLVQQSKFRDEKYAIDAEHSLRKGSSLRSLNPFIHTDGLIRVGGRLERSHLTFVQKHPIILPPTTEI
jgi:hypothetical protein